MIGARSKSLIWKFGSVLLLVQLTVGVIFAFAAGSTVSRTIETQYERRLQSLVLALVRQIEGGVGLEQIYVPGDVRLTFITESGSVLSDSDRDTESMDGDLNYRPEVEAALRDGSGLSIRYSNQLNQEMMYAARMVAVPGGDRIVVRAAFDLADIRETSTRYTLIILFLSTLVLGATAATFWLIRRRILSEVRGIHDLIRQMGESGPLQQSTRDLSRRVSSELTRLVRRLGRSSTTIRSKLEAVEQSQSETQGILASMSNGVIALDTSRRILTMNPAAIRMFRLLGRNIRGRLMEEVVRDPALLNAITDGVEEGRMLFREIELESLGGRTVEIGVEPLFGGDTLVMTGILVILNDTTKLRRLERIRKDFAANVSHELRTPLTAIQGYVELLAPHVRDDQGRERLAVIERNVGRLNSIIEDLLTLSRIESDGESSMPLQLEPIIVEDLLHASASLCQPTATTGRITIRVEVSEGLMVRGNRPLLDQAIINLLENAIRYSDPETVITLRAQADQVGTIQLAVEDQGCGIAAEHLPRLFERFYRVDAGRSRDLGGTGLGLSIVRHIALIHGGSVDIESVVGVGSTFFLTIPATESGSGSSVTRPLSPPSTD